jgi:hypothetical protein
MVSKPKTVYFIAMTPSGRWDLRELIFGSVADRVLKKATVPLLEKSPTIVFLGSLS